NNTVLARLKESGSLGTMSFCPTEYHGRGESSYLRELGEKLDSAVDVFWTGSHVCSPALTVENARAASASLRRTVVFWDNYPVNDLEMRFDAHLGPLTGRAPALAGVARGLVAAAGSNSESSKVALHTVADYLSDPAGYLPEAAWRDALLAVAGSAAEADAVGTLADLARRSPLNPGTQYANHLLGTLDRFWAAWGGVPASSGPDLPGLPPGHGRAMAASAPDRRAALARLQGDLAPLRAAAARLLAPMANARLQQELRPWSEKLSGWLRVVDAALAVLAAALHDPRDPALSLLREAALDQLLLTRENFHWVAGDMLDQFARRCFWAAEELGSTPRGG
ncbi:MAG TPA: beta-N-acetylglucosaminidase domain-containing protein, partial [Deinococcales bacterium]|nr:beta-N-acetylglucosaminidase domain-containing protein [Deinococcales bacterium]